MSADSDCTAQSVALDQAHSASQSHSSSQNNLHRPDLLPPTSELSPLQHRLRSKLATIRSAALSIAEGYRESDEYVITSLQQHTAKAFEDTGHVTHWAVERVEVIEEYKGTSYKQAAVPRLWNAAILCQTCCMMNYLLIGAVRRILEEEEDYKEGRDSVTWHRCAIYPRLLLTKQSEIMFTPHDILQISFLGQSFVLDLTGDQFGLPDWFYKKESYEAVCVWRNVWGPETSRAMDEDDVRKQTEKDTPEAKNLPPVVDKQISILKKKRIGMENESAHEAEVIQDTEFRFQVWETLKYGA
ncbi:hypothetical protein P280DRAFT_521787 [Massarina eburnea CBS 473.64]|uniref:Uncharacterized protein n=1 Tax=Massarina eburnea CBS 473.64 TaxID=1395130 RepID=A0A6A6RMX5_9PLEO|nr:hypothetical protein P280DRAFT_521787 [Massarina eburnea CBS 473.64]